MSARPRPCLEPEEILLSQRLSLGHCFVDEASQTLNVVVGVQEQPLEATVRLIVRPFNRRQQDLVFRLEVVMDDCAGHAGLPGDVSDASASETALSKGSAGGGTDVVPRLSCSSTLRWEGKSSGLPSRGYTPELF